MITVCEKKKIRIWTPYIYRNLPDFDPMLDAILNFFISKKLDKITPTVQQIARCTEIELNQLKNDFIAQLIYFLNLRRRI